MPTDEVKTRAHRQHGKDVEGVLIPSAIGCAIVTANLHVHTAIWWAMLTVTTVVWIAEIVFSSSRTHGHGRLDDFLSGQSTSVGFTPLVAIIVSWHAPHAARWVPLLATLGAGVLAAACWSVAAWIRRRRGRTP